MNVKILNNKGITIPLVLIVLALASIFGFSALFVMNTQTRFNVLDDASKKALEYAEAGYNKYLWHLNDQPDFYIVDKAKSNDDKSKIEGKDMPFQDGFYRLEITKPEDTDRFVTIKSTGWTKSNPDIRRTIEAKVRKKQFVHHVYVSNKDEYYKDGKLVKIWWTSGDESHGPYHTNLNLYTQEGDQVYNAILKKNVKYPIFFDTITYSGIHEENITKSNKSYAYLKDIPSQIKPLEFPPNNLSLKLWAEKDDMVFYGRTCIYLMGDQLKIRNGKDTAITYSLSSIKNKVIYVEKAEGGGTEKFDLKSGNIFISGELKGVLTIAAANDIYITYKDPTDWSKPKNVPADSGGIIYSDTKFNEGYGGSLSYYDNEKKIWTRQANGKDMLGLVANRNIFILHHNWPRNPDESGNAEKKEYWYNGKKYIGWPYYVYVENPYDVAPKNVTIHASLFAVNGGFGYEAYDAYDSDSDKWGYFYTKKGDITLWGNITQNARLPVGLINNTGYNKKYAHDPRMFYDYPPHILEPVNVGWEIHDWKEIQE